MNRCPNGCKNKGEHLHFAFPALLMQSAVGGGCAMVNGLEGFVEAPLFLIPAPQRNSFYGVFGLQEPLGGALEPLVHNIRMDGRLYQFMKTGLQFFSIYDKFLTELLDRMILV